MATPDDPYSNEKYWASLPKEECVAELMKKANDWTAQLNTTGLYRRLRKSYAAYYGYSPTNTGHTSSEVIKSGVQGELSLVKVNHYRNLVQHMLIMTTNNRPAMEARAVNTDYRSQAQTILANGILDYYMREKKLERYLKQATEYALVFGEGFIRLEWDSSLGDEYMVDPDSGRIQHTGDIKYSVLTPGDVIKDVYQLDNNDHDWLIVRHYKNRYELMAKYPELADEIMAVRTKQSEERDININVYFRLGMGTDLIPVYEFYHKKSDAMPEGRQIVYLNDKAVFFDGPLPYRQIPIFRIAPADFIGTPFGYSGAFDLLSMQEVLDALYSTVVTNQSTFGVQNVMAPQGHNIEVSQLAGGLNFITYDGTVGKPEPLNLTSTPPEIFNFIGKLEATMETISGVNSVARGNPEANLRSGNSLALIQSMAIAFNSGLQQSYAQLIEDVGTNTLTTLRDFAAVPRVAMIVGKNNRAMMREFTGNDLDKINRVVVDVGNPLSKTTAGKLEIANNMMQMGLIKTPEEYISVMKTGNLDSMLEGEMSELMLIKSENERLSEGKPVIATAVDMHLLHIQEHKSVISSPDVRENPEILAVTLNHIQEHLDLLRNTDPDLLQILGQPPLQQAPPPPEVQPQALPPEEVAMQNEVLAEPDVGTVPEMSEVEPVLNPQNLVANQPVNMPSVPKNPLSGEPWNPETGGL